MPYKFEILAAAAIGTSDEARVGSLREQLLAVTQTQLLLHRVHLTPIIGRCACTHERVRVFFELRNEQTGRSVSVGQQCVCNFLTPFHIRHFYREARRLREVPVDADDARRLRDDWIRDRANQPADRPAARASQRRALAAATSSIQTLYSPVSGRPIRRARS